MHVHANTYCMLEKTLGEPHMSTNICACSMCTRTDMHSPKHRPRKPSRGAHRAHKQAKISKGTYACTPVHLRAYLHACVQAPLHTSMHTKRLTCALECVHTQAATQTHTQI